MPFLDWMCPSEASRSLFSWFTYVNNLSKTQTSFFEGGCISILHRSVLFTSIFLFYIVISYLSLVIFVKSIKRCPKFLPVTFWDCELWIFKSFKVPCHLSIKQVVSWLCVSPSYHLPQWTVTELWEFFQSIINYFDVYLLDETR